MAVMMGLSVRELLTESYNELNRHSHGKVVLPERTLSEISIDSDWHRTSRSYMNYREANILKFGEKTWAIARGEVDGPDCLAKHYDSDILALELSFNEKMPEQIQKELAEKIIESSYFKNSLIFGMSNGSLMINRSGRFGEKMFDLLRQKGVPSIGIKRPRDDEAVSEIKYEPLYCISYSKRTIDKIVESIETALLTG